MRDAPWQVTSNSQQSAAIAGGCLAVGALFVWLTRGAAPGDTTSTSALWLGVLLAAVGVAGLVFAEDVVVTVEPSRRRLRVERRMRWGQKSTEVAFDEVSSVRVVKVGSGSEGTPSYWLQILTRSGTSLATGRWSTDEAEMNRLARQLADAVGCGCEHGEPLPPTGAAHLAVAAAGAVVVYALWFRVQVGPWCPAMWFGTAPPVIMLLSFAALLGLLRRLAR